MLRVFSVSFLKSSTFFMNNYRGGIICFTIQNGYMEILELEYNKLIRGSSVEHSICTLINVFQANIPETGFILEKREFILGSGVRGKGARYPITLVPYSHDLKVFPSLEITLHCKTILQRSQYYIS